MKKHQKLNELTHPQLLELVEMGINGDKEYSKKVERYLMAQDPKRLAKSIKQQLNGINRSNKFLDYYHSITMSNELFAILHTIEKNLLPLSPELTNECCALINKISVKLLERADDSSGDIGSALRSVTPIWGRAVAAEKLSHDDVAKLVFDLWNNDPYCLHHTVITDFSNALGKMGIAELEKRLITYSPESSYDNQLRNNALKDIADSQGNIERYIELCNPLQNKDHLAIAQRFIKAGFGDKALHWLKQYATQNHDKNVILYQDAEYVKLATEAHLLEGEDKLAQEVRWQAFEQTLFPDYYLDYIKYAPKEVLNNVQQKALLLAEKSTDSMTAIHFLAAINEYGILSDYIIKNNKIINDAYYSELRKLSKILHQQGFHLAAILLRRVLAEGLIGRAQSKYYSYAANDLKQAQDYAVCVTDWQKIPNEILYWQQLKTQHARKTSFWYEIESKMKTIFV